MNMAPKTNPTSKLKPGVYQTTVAPFKLGPVGQQGVVVQKTSWTNGPQGPIGQYGPAGQTVGLLKKSIKFKKVDSLYYHIYSDEIISWLREQKVIEERFPVSIDSGGVHTYITLTEELEILLLLKYG